MNKRAFGIVAASALAIVALAAPAAAAGTSSQVVHAWSHTHVIKATPSGVIQQWFVNDAGTVAAHDTMKPVDRFGPFDAAEFDYTFVYSPTGYWAEVFPAASYYVGRTNVDPQVVLAKLPK